MKLWLACNSERWLLIFDNADNTDDRNIDYAIYIPHSKKGDILITTRDPECGAFEAGPSHSLECLEPELARELLLRAAHIAEHGWKEREEAALAIVEILGSHTLAILQAGAYIRRKLCTLEEYPAIFQERKQELLRFQTKQGMSAYGNVYSTFEVSAKYLQNSNLPKHLDALDFLHTLAFMHNRGISETIFQRAHDYGLELRDTGVKTEDILSLSTGHVERLPKYIQQALPTPQNRLRWREARATLESLPIITVDGDDCFITMHSLVHAWAKERQDHQERCRAWQSAATILALSCKVWYCYCSFFVVLQPHVRACVSHELESYMQSLSEIEAAQLLFQFAYVLYRMDDWSALSSLLRFIRLRLQHADRVNKNIALEIKRFIGREFLERGNYPEAIEIYKEVLYLETQVLAEDHPVGFTSEERLACAYKCNGQLKEAKELLENVIINKVQKFAEDDSRRLLIEHGLADVYKSCGQIEEAIKLYVHILRIDKRLAEDHPDRLASQYKLAAAYRENEQIDKAVELLEHVIKVERSLAEDHPNRLSSQYELAVTYRKNKQIDKAVGLLEHVVKVEGSLAEDHPRRLSSQHELAVTYYQNENIDKAIQLLEHVVKFEKKKLREDHPDRLASEYKLAAAYRKNGQIDDAVRLFKQVVKIEEKKYNEDHPNRLKTQYGLAIAYQEKGQLDEAVRLFEHVARIEEKKYDKDHPFRLTSQRALAEAKEASRRQRL